MSRFSCISRVAVTGSTNDDIARILGEEHARGLTLVADYQERGSGRKGRAWIAPPASALLCTIALPDALPANEIWAVPFWTALVLDAAMREFGIEPQVQWPNDLLIAGRKAAGILCVSRVIGDYAWIGCGIGVNVLRPVSDARINAIDPPPAFLSDVADVDREAFLQVLLLEADRLYGELESPARVVHAWERAARIPGAGYRIAMDGRDEPFDANARRLLPGGALLVERGGEPIEVSLADARVLH